MKPIEVEVPLAAGPSIAVMLVSSTVMVAFAAVAKQSAEAAADIERSLFIARSPDSAGPFGTDRLSRSIIPPEDAPLRTNRLPMLNDWIVNANC